MKKGTLVISLAILVAGICIGFAANRYKLYPQDLATSVRERIEATLGIQPETLKFVPPSYFISETKGRNRAACPNEDPLVFLAIGQSHAANFYASFGDEDATKQAFQFYEGHCYLMMDPVLGATGEHGSLWTEFAQRLSISARKPVIFLVGGVGGSSVEQWVAAESPYFARIKKQLALAKDAGIAVDFIVWNQGEQDVAIATPADVYKARLEQLIERLDGEFRSGLIPRWVIFQTTICRDNPNGDPELRAVQKSVAETWPGAIAGPNADRLRHRYRYDGCHFNGRGKAKIIDELEQIVLDALRP